MKAPQPEISRAHRRRIAAPIADGRKYGRNYVDNRGRKRGECCRYVIRLYQQHHEAEVDHTHSDDIHPIASHAVSPIQNRSNNYGLDREYGKVPCSLLKSTPSHANNLHQRRFTGAIVTDEADALA